MYVSEDGKLHYVDKDGADTALPFSGGIPLNQTTSVYTSTAYLSKTVSLQKGKIYLIFGSGEAHTGYGFDYINIGEASKTPGAIVDGTLGKYFTTGYYKASNTCSASVILVCEADGDIIISHQASNNRVTACYTEIFEMS